MPAPRTYFIQHSCFGYYDASFSECANKCRICDACRNATESDECEDIRKIYKYKSCQIDALVEKWKNR